MGVVLRVCIGCWCWCGVVWYNMSVKSVVQSCKGVKKGRRNHRFHNFTPKIMLLPLPVRILFLLFIYLISTPIADSKCCKRCEAGKPCGNSCISSEIKCTEPHGCACFGAQDDCTHHCNPKKDKPCGNKCVPHDEICQEPHGTACFQGDVERYYHDDRTNLDAKKHLDQDQEL